MAEIAVSLRTEMGNMTSDLDYWIAMNYQAQVYYVVYKDIVPRQEEYRSYSGVPFPI